MKSIVTLVQFDRKSCWCLRSKRQITIGLTAVLLLGVFLYRKCFPMELERPGYYARSTICKDDFQAIEGNVSFAYSAYIDDRPARDIAPNDGPVVRIFVYILRSMKAKNNWQCLFWYNSTVEPVKKPVIGITDLNEFAQPRMMPAMVLCSLPQNKELSPQSVSLVPKSALFPNNFICITDLRQKREKSIKEPSGMSENATKIARFPTFTICTKAIHDDHYSVHDIVNFIEVNRILGAEKFIFYTDKKINDHLNKQCLESYRERGIIEIYPFTPPVLDSLAYHGQIITMTECMYRVMYRTKYVINCDLDEFIVPVNSQDWNQMLISIHRKSPNSDRIVSYSFQNQFFPLQKENDPLFANDTIVRRHRITTLQQTMKENRVFPHQERSKVMARPEKILIWHMHLIVQQSLIDQNDLIYQVHQNDSLMYHYRQWETSSKLIRDRRMHEFASRSIENIHFSLGHCLPVE